MNVKVCDNEVVGMLIADDAGRRLMFARSTPPVGVAPPAGHVDDHGGTEDAARAEVSEEVGLIVDGLRPLLVRWLPNACRRVPGVRGVGHTWTVYETRASGQVVLAPREARDARWRTPADVQRLADRTVAYAHGRVTGAAFAAEPGLEPVWVLLLHELGDVAVGPVDLDAVAALAATPPDGMVGGGR